MEKIKVGDKVFYHNIDEIYTVTKVDTKYVFLKEAKGRYNIKNLRKATLFEQLWHEIRKILS